jgi:hypothetical protein
MHQEYLDRLKIQKLNRKMLENMSGGRDMYAMDLESPVVEIPEDEAMWLRLKSHAISLLSTKLNEKIENIFQMTSDGEGFTENEIEEGVSNAQITLVAGKKILEMLSIYSFEVVPCIPPDYKPIEVFLGAVEEYLVVEVLDTIADLGPDNGYVFNLINFLERFIAQVDAHPHSRNED